MRTANVQKALDQSDLLSIPRDLVRKESKILREGDLLVSTANSWNLVGKCCWVPALSYPATAGGFIAILRGDDRKVDRRYLYHWFSSPDTQLNARNCGRQTTNIANMDVNRCLALEMPLPPLPEQRRIAAILDKADALRAKRREAIAKLDQLLQSVFLDMFGDPVSNPKGWPMVKSGELYAEKPRIGTTRPATGKGCLVVRVGEVGDYKIALDKSSRVELPKADFDRYVLRSGDTVLARAIGSKDQLGKCSYFDGHQESVCIDSHVMRIRPEPSICEPAWFHFLISSPSGKSMLQAKGGATAVQFNINASQASDMDVALPPLVIQRRFLKISEQVRQQGDRSIQAAAQQADLFSSLQQRAFKGAL